MLFTLNPEPRTLNPPPTRNPDPGARNPPPRSTPLPLPAHANPFRAQRIDALPFRPRGVTWEGLLDRLRQLQHTAAIVGPHGTGKTTLLDRLETDLRAAGHAVVRLALHRPGPRLPDRPLQHVGPGVIVMLDGADLLGLLAWRRFRRECCARGAAGLVVTSHRRRLLPVLVETATDPALLDTLLDELVPDADAALRAHAHALYRYHRGNLRAAWRDLYDTCAAPPTPLASVTRQRDGIHPAPTLLASRNTVTLTGDARR